MMETNDAPEQAGDPTLRVLNLADDMRRKGSDRLTRLPTIENPPTFDDVYVVCGVRPWPTSPDDLDDLAVRLSNFLEDLHRLHVDRALRDADAVGALAPPMGLPIVHRARLREAREAPGYDWLSSPPSEREFLCQLILVVSQWVGPVVRERSGKVLERCAWSREWQLAEIDAAARIHGLRCVALGAIPQDE